MRLRIKIILFTFLALFLLKAGEADSFTGSVPSHNIRIEFDLKNHTVEVVDRLIINAVDKNEIKFSIHKNVSIRKISETGGMDLHYFIRDGKEKKDVTVVHLPVNKSVIEMDIHYTGRFPDLPGDIKFSREFLSDKPVAYAGEEIILLDGSACWYPCMGRFTTFHVTTVTPTACETVMEGTRVSREERNGVTTTSWDFPHPVEDIYLAGGKYIVNEDTYNNISIYTYFFPEDTGLSQGYMDYSKKYLELYESLFGRYPFSKFAVVENILPTGFGMPSYTLLGQTVLRLPFMVKTSLGHEIAHNWWGNYVYPDYRKGNWSEGLTTYTADYLYDEMEGKGASYRNQLLRDYTNYTYYSNEYPLTRFVRRENPADRAIGYGKGAFVFHMLRQMLGDEVFYKGLRGIIADRGFKVASWDDFRITFEKVSGKDLKWFFRQWVEGAGAPQITVGDLKVIPDSTPVSHPEYIAGSQNMHGQEIPKPVRDDKNNDPKSGYVIKAEILQKGVPFEIYLTVSVETERGSILSSHWVRGSSNTVEIRVPSRPVSITLDPNYDVFRRLSQEEIPATMGRFAGGNEKVVVVPPHSGKDLAEAYSRAASILGGSLKIDTPLLPSSIKTGEDTVSINDKVYDRNDSVLAVTLESPYNKDAVVVFLAGNKGEDIVSVADRLVHYGKYSYLLFLKGENVVKGIWEAGKLRRDIHEN